LHPVSSDCADGFKFPSISKVNARLSAEVVTGAGEVIAYGCGIANGSQDPTTFEMTYPEMPVYTNATLVGDGRRA
jgi:hypothetical protein